MATRIRADEATIALVGLRRWVVLSLDDPPLVVLLQLPERALGVPLLDLLQLESVMLDDGVEHDRDDVAVGAPHVGGAARLTKKSNDLLGRRTLGQLQPLLDLHPELFGQRLDRL